MFTLAELHMRTHMTVYFAITRGNVGRSDSLTWDHERLAVETNMLRNLTNVRTLLDNTKYEIRIGGHFPRQTCAALLNKIDRIFRSLSLISYSARTFNSADSQESPSAWMQELRMHTTPNEEVESRFASALAICGPAIARGRPLPPFLDISAASSLLNALQESSLDLLNMKYAHEPGYIALATVHASALLVENDLRELVQLTSELVGRTTFT